MRYLRFSLDEYQHLAGLWNRLDLGGRAGATVKPRLVEALWGLSPDLARRITCLPRAGLDLLQDHFQQRARFADEHHFTPEEVRVVIQACHSTPFPARLARRFKGVLVENLREDWPELSRKLGRLSGHQFKRLHKQAGWQSRRSV